MNEVIICIWTA